MKRKSFINQEDGIEIEAALIEGVKIAPTAVGGNIELADLWFLFVSIIGNNSWLSYGVTDTLIGEPEASLDHVDLEQIKKLSIVIGSPWEQVEREGIKKCSTRQIASRQSMPDELKQTMLDLDYEDLVLKKGKIEFEAIAATYKNFPMILSLN